MNEKEKEAIKELKSLGPSEEAIETVLNLLEKKDEEIEYYKNQKRHDEQFKHDLLREIRCKSLTIDSLNKILDDRLICIQGGRGLYSKLKGLDKEYLIREYLLMYKMSKTELEKKDKIINLMEDEINKLLKDSFERIGLDVYLEKENITVRELIERKIENGN